MNQKIDNTHRLFFLENRINKCRKLFRKKVVIKPENNLLEIGFGQGQETLWFASLKLNIVSIEIDKTHCKNLKKNLKYESFPQTFQEVIRADAQNLPIRANYFDVIFCKAALHHVGSAQEVTNEMLRSVKNSGFVIAIDEPTRLNPLRVLTFFIEKRLGFQTYWTSIGTELLEETFCPFQLDAYFKKSGFSNINSGSIWLPYYIHNKFYQRGWLLTEKLIEKTFLPYIFGQLYIVARKPLN